MLPEILQGLCNWFFLVINYAIVGGWGKGGEVISFSRHTRYPTTVQYSRGKKRYYATLPRVACRRCSRARGGSRLRDTARVDPVN